jgi:hypothetical protein
VTAQLAAVADPDAASGDELAVLRGMLRQDFLARAGWDPVAQVLTPVRGDPLLSLRECAVAGCTASTAHRRADLCVTCRTRWKASELAWDDFLARPSGARCRGDRPCRVTGCPRPGESDERLCATHTAQRQRHRGLPADLWLARPEVGPLPSFGACIVASCAATAANRSGMCGAHSIAWCRHRRDHGGAVPAGWARHAAPADVAGHEVVLRRSDIPKDPDRQPRPRSLPGMVLKVIAENLGVFEERCGISERRITEVLIDTGRRPDEICVLPWDCLERDPSGSPVLIYTDAKNNRPGRRLPVSEATAAVITAQKDWTRRPSYLPELKSYLQQLLADRERLHAATDLQPWARAQVTPPDEQVTRVRELIRRIEADMDDLSDTDRAQIRQAVTAIRAVRQTVMLGMPAIRPAAGNR